jgi:membrane fusion protein (multidrug efflux system)
MTDHITEIPDEVLTPTHVPRGSNGHGSQAHPHPETPPAHRRTPLVPTVALLLLGAVALGMGGLWWYRSLGYESTDDAFIQGDVVTLSPKVAGLVADVAVADNQMVQAGDRLVQLDPRDFQAKLAQAHANLAAAEAQRQAATINVGVTDTTTGAGVAKAEAGVQSAQRQLDGARSKLEQSRAQVAAADAEAMRTAADAQRYDALFNNDRAVSRQQWDNAVAAARSGAANLDAARQAQQAAQDGVRQAEAQLGEAQAQLASAKAAPQQVAYSQAQAAQAAGQVAQLQAAVRQAELDLSYTKLVAPVAGRITRKSAQTGNYVQVGQALLSIVPQQVHVIANFKETQLAHMRPGQPVAVKVDAYPDHTFPGHLDSIQAGSGAAFSLLPPENATGNYVKIVQRVPVKIVIDEPPDPAHVLGPGMSVVPTVTVR